MWVPLGQPESIQVLGVPRKSPNVCDPPEWRGGSHDIAERARIVSTIEVELL